MSKLVVVEGDPVDGTDTHKVTGSDTTVPTPAPYTGTGDYQYKGELRNDLSDVVTVGGKPLALVTSGSELRTDGQLEHAATAGSNFTPATPTPNPKTLSFVPPTGVGVGKPSEGAGSSLLTVNDVKVLLAGDRFDTCGIAGGTAGSTVAAQGQDFITCSE